MSGVRLSRLVPRRTLHTWRNKSPASDAVLFGAGTLRAYSTTLTVSHPQLLQQRTHAGKPSQPVYILITYSANLNPEIRFFQQQVLRWLLTTTAGALFCKERQEFERILAFETPTAKVDIHTALQHLTILGIKRLAVLGGSTCVASMLELDLIDEFWLTICPLILDGSTAPTPVEGSRFFFELAACLQLLEVHTVEQEVFLHYRLQ